MNKMTEFRGKEVTMTVAEAKKILAGSLAMGNDAQLRADKFLVAVEEARKARLACDSKHFQPCDCWESRFSNDVIFSVIER